MTPKCNLIYFSPTGTTRTICGQIAEGLGDSSPDIYDLTLPQKKIKRQLTEGVAVIGLPVYAGRVPEVFLQRFAGFTAANLPTVLIALYGNREFEDALVELRDLVPVCGFKVVAAAAFIGEHSYATAEFPIAAGRPDREDLQQARELGQRVAEKLAKKNFTCPEIAGNTPYRERVKLGGLAPDTDHGKCTLCGVCVSVCPTGVISLTPEVTTRAESCVMCCACTRGCSFAARIFEHPPVQEKRMMLWQKCREAKMPKVFL